MKNQKQYDFPDEEEIQKVIKRMTQPGYRRINQGLIPNATTEEKIKYELCKSIVGYAIKNDLTEENLRGKLNIDQIELEHVLFCHINKLNIQKLTSYTDSLNIPYGREKATSRTH